MSAATLPVPMPAPEVLVMAGGEGRRLGTLTSQVPKPMLPVGGRPVLQHTLEQLRDQGIAHAYLAVRHLSHVISRYFGNGRWLGIDLDYVVEPDALGTAGAMGMLPALGEPLLVVNGDVVTHIPVAALAASHHQYAAALTVGYVEHRLPVAYGVIESAGAEVVQLHEKPAVALSIVAGVYLISPEIVAGVPLGVRLAMPELISSVLAASGRVVGFQLAGPWLDIGTPATYACAEQVAMQVGANVTATLGVPTGAAMRLGATSAIRLAAGDVPR